MGSRSGDELEAAMRVDAKVRGEERRRESPRPRSYLAMVVGLVAVGAAVAGYAFVRSGALGEYRDVVVISAGLLLFGWMVWTALR